jgi:hypothetical protein
VEMRILGDGDEVVDAVAEFVEERCELGMG